MIYVGHRLARGWHGQQRGGQGEARQKHEEQRSLAHQASGSADQLSHAGKVGSAASGGKAFGARRPVTPCSLSSLSTPACLGRRLISPISPSPHRPVPARSARAQPVASVQLRCSSGDVSVMLRRNFDGTSMVLRWYFDGTSMVLRWYFEGFRGFVACSHKGNLSCSLSHFGGSLVVIEDDGRTDIAGGVRPNGLGSCLCRIGQTLR